MEKVNLHRGHRERMIKRFLENGRSGLSDHELLEIILFYSIPRVNTNETAHRLLDKFGSLKGVFTADEKSLLKVKGLGKATVGFLHSIYEISGLYTDRAYHEPDSISDSNELCSFAREYFRNSRRDSSLCMVIASAPNNKILSKAVFPYNDLLNERISNSDVITHLIKLQAKRSFIILKRSGVSSIPTAADLNIIKRLGEALIHFDIKLSDAVIYCEGSTLSLTESRYMSISGKHIIFKSPQLQIHSI